MKKYELTDETIEFYGRTLYRIRACRDFETITGLKVKAGDLGGFVETEENLLHDGLCWVYDNAKVCDNAQVWGNAKVCGNAVVYGNAKVYNAADIFGNAEVFGDAVVYGYAEVYNAAEIFGNARVSGSAKISGSAIIQTSQDYIAISPIGSRNDVTTFYKTDSGIDVRCGCFNGSIEKFLKAVEETHGDNKYGKAYRAAAELAKIQIEVNSND